MSIISLVFLRGHNKSEPARLRYYASFKDIGIDSTAVTILYRHSTGTLPVLYVPVPLRYSFGESSSWSKSLFSWSIYCVPVALATLHGYC